MFKSKFLKNTNLNDPKACYTLNNGVKIPVIGFGTWQLKNGDETYNAVKKALETGYRHIDTAEGYGNEESVGRAIKDSKIARKEIFLTTKITNSHLTYEEGKKAILGSLKRLGVDYIDLYLIHWPNPIGSRPNYEKRNKEIYQAMEEAYQEGKIRALGVSNFNIHHLKALFKTAKVIPAVNQIYINPSDLQPELVELNEKNNILTEAYSPLGTGRIFQVEILKKMAEKYKKTIAQLAIRWSLEHGFLPLPKSATPTRIEENLEVFDFSIQKSDIEIIDNLRGSAGLAVDADKVGF